ncbi:Similar to bab1: Protein bric-a-brac 1 (Drosophila melanogaster) [Cotesia congregata]|uniref:Similar to bab1: Protein bric-a-brac 1 (Drosophila melanogaster) n=1 Tax=Cotesia congregata TaxID=51543 RepID=A0A8J2HCQ6_COTCN|nr:Similar to bab1: Protein bric-a-brac 1 (Drosophila melanogaster) [Cotesia congregata]
MRCGPRLEAFTEIAMKETSKEYILQWSGHAASITERFSGLLAKQALVDVTLICQKQKLRVHKLVLASCSLYFEEMLEQDLGQEPIILLKDLDFDILKAMVEFMYCGETTIAHCHLKPLLEAAHVFKVKDLESIVQCMMSTKNYIDDTDKSSNLDQDLSNTNNSSVTHNCVQVKLSGREPTEKLSSPATELSDSKNSKDNQPVELEHTVIELEDTLIDLIDTSVDSNEHEAAIFCDIIESTNKLATRSNENKSANFFQENVNNLNNKKLNNYIHCDNQALFMDKNNLILNDVSCNIDNENKDEKCSHSCNNKLENLESNLDLSDLPSEVGECSKVYTYKKRKLTNSKKFSSFCTSNMLIKSDKIDCIDLSCDTAPVTLPSLALDMNATDRVWSMNTDNIHYIIGSTLNQTNALIRDRQRIVYEEIDTERTIIPNHKSIRQIKELFSVDNDNISMGQMPILRRSVRLNQLETDDSVNNNSEETQKIKDKHVEIKSLSKSLTKAKRTKELSTNGRVSDENSVSKKSVNNPRPKKNTKLTSKNAGSSRCLAKMKDDKSRNKIKNSKITKVEPLDTDGYSPIKLNTIASVERALWGDMSDVIENHDAATKIPEYSMSKEIPFAVGLLPLHAALERMQAIPDYQPRKTRSSFATPMKHDSNHLNFKRKAPGATADTEYDSIYNKKQCSLEQMDDNSSNTFCHIKIQTSSQCSQSCDNSMMDQLVTIGSNFHKR